MKNASKIPVLPMPSDDPDDILMSFFTRDIYKTRHIYQSKKIHVLFPVDDSCMRIVSGEASTEAFEKFCRAWTATWDSLTHATQNTILRIKRVFKLSEIYLTNVWEHGGFYNEAEDGECLVMAQTGIVGSVLTFFLPAIEVYPVEAIMHLIAHELMHVIWWADGTAYANYYREPTDAEITAMFGFDYSKTELRAWDKHRVKILRAARKIYGTAA